MARATYHHGNLRAALLEAGERLLREHGAANISLRSVARAAGVSHTAPYRHFADKQALLAALAETGFLRLRDAMYASITKHPDDPRQQFVESAAAYVGLAVANPEMNQLMFSGTVPDDARSDSFRETAQASFQGLLDIIENGMRAGLYVDRPLLELAATAWSLVHGLAMLVSTGKLPGSDTPDTDPQTMARRMAERLLDGITAR
ncbi:MAG TPA: TetR/AcrR family transcriptional regulator [Woeseiaceae bacterium]|nr:TetR/AcrR family transcriptional regulator [Woeseiaceae bacterium]